MALHNMEVQFRQQLILVLVLLSLTRDSIATLHCGNCGLMAVPYPLSTSASCGDQSYKVRCSAGMLWFDTLNRSSYAITSISPQTQSLTIRPPDFLGNRCITTDFRYGGIWLDDNLPFTISSSNTVLMLNCSSQMIALSAMNCSSNSVCHKYIRDNAAAGERCSMEPSCCSYTTGGSKTAHRIDLTSDDCSAFVSFVNLDGTSVSHWPTPGVEIKWVLPRQPICRSPSDCQILANSSCLPDPMSKGLNRCFCNAGHLWDPINGICSCSKQCGRHSARRQLTRGLTFTATASLVLILLGILAYKHHQRRKREAYRNLVKKHEEILTINTNGKLAKLFSGKEIKRATKNFSQDNLLGSGAFGEVFKGVVDDGTITAVKRAKLGDTKGIDQVLNEVRVLCQVNHRSLVQLLGCCLELEHPVLVYEYVPNGTLFDHLHGRYSNNWGTLTWQRRLLIAHQTADGLAYLHFSAVPPILHRDIKSSNILLDEKMDAKVSDFGLSRLVDTDATHISTCAQGTFGYLDPEYYQNFQLTDKSDVYSFGVVLLELLTSKKAIDFNREDEDVNLAVYVRKMADEEQLMDIVDPALKNQASDLELESMKALGLLAVACLDEKRQDRPSMREVAEEIEYILQIIADEALKA